MTDKTIQRDREDPVKFLPGCEFMENRFDCRLLI